MISVKTPITISVGDCRLSYRCGCSVGPQAALQGTSRSVWASVQTPAYFPLRGCCEVPLSLQRGAAHGSTASTSLRHVRVRLENHQIISVEISTSISCGRKRIIRKLRHRFLKLVFSSLTQKFCFKGVGFRHVILHVFRDPIYVLF